jgi:hypothetical protein
MEIRVSLLVNGSFPKREALTGIWAGTITLRIRLLRVLSIGSLPGQSSPAWASDLKLPPVAKPAEVGLP